MDEKLKEAKIVIKRGHPHFENGDYDKAIAELAK
jgi:hypothetical protein